MKRFVISSVVIAAASVIAYQYISNRNMLSISAVRASNAAFSPTYLPVAIFVGGTSGVGQGIAEAFARHTKGNAHIIIVGRNKAAAEEILSKLPKPTNPDAVHEFFSCDATSMKEVQSVSQEILKRVQKVNFLVMSPGFFSAAGRDETDEGIDKKLAVHYYARWKFTKELVPALANAQEQGEDAKVFSVLSAGHGGKIDLDDLGLKKTFSISKAASQAATYNDLMVVEFAARYPKISFAHVFPGGVRTNLLSSARTWWMRALNPVVLPLMYPFSLSVTESGEYLFHGMLEQGSAGAFRIGSRGENLGMPDYPEDARKKLWEHSAKETRSD